MYNIFRTRFRHSDAIVKPNAFLISYPFLQNVGVDKGDIPDLAKVCIAITFSSKIAVVTYYWNIFLLQAPSSLLEALEDHLKAMEGNKKGKGGSNFKVTMR